MRGDWGEKFQSLRYCTGPAVSLPIGWVPGEEHGVQGRGMIDRREPGAKRRRGRIKLVGNCMSGKKKERQQGEGAQVGGFY